MSDGNKLTKENFPQFLDEGYKLDFLNDFTITPDENQDSVNTKVWGILTSKQKEDIRKSFSGEEEISGEVKYTRKETKIDIITILKLRDSLGGKKGISTDLIETLIKRHSKTNGVGFEYFLWDYLERNNENNDISFEKPGYHLDQDYGSDLVVNFTNIDGSKINIGLDLTLSMDKDVRTKKLSKMKIINKKLKNGGIKDYSSVRTPKSIGIVFINRKQLGAINNPFTEVLQKFYESEKPIGGPSQYLEKGLQSKMEELSLILISVFEKISKNNFTKYKLGEFHINFQQNGNRLVIRAAHIRELVFEFIVDIPNFGI